MLIGLTGSTCAGKKEIVDYLRDDHGYQVLEIGVTVPSAQEALEYVMQDMRWQANHVVFPIQSIKELHLLRKRPFFYLLEVDAPVMLRYQRCVRQGRCLDLEDFVRKSDRDQQRLWSFHPEVRLYNAYETVEQFRRYLDQMNITNHELVRPSWDTYFLRLCEWAAHRTNCMKRRVGCVLVIDRKIVATGYNGTPRGIKNCIEGGCRRCNSSSIRCGESLDECLCLHAEENALLEVGRERLVSGYPVLYCNTCPVRIQLNGSYLVLGMC
jgi:dCMP deaminase